METREDGLSSKYMEYLDKYPWLIDILQIMQWIKQWYTHLFKEDGRSARRSLRIDYVHDRKTNQIVKSTKDHVI